MFLLALAVLYDKLNLSYLERVLDLARRLFGSD